MIINDLEENKIDIVKDLHNTTAPVLQIMDNEYVVPFGGKLILNYHVCPYYGVEHPNDGRSIAVGKPSNSTFTFVTRIDEDVLDLEDVPEFKLTTLEGEQVMEIDVSELEPGQHSALVQVISNGASSPTIWLKFRIKDENEELIQAEHTFDLGSLEIGQQFTSEYSMQYKNYIDADSGDPVQTPTNTSLKYVVATLDIPAYNSNKKVVERVIVANYTVTRVSEDKISIVVAPGGKIYYTFVNNWIGFYRGDKPNNYGNARKWGNDGIIIEDISGTYNLTNTITHNGSTYLLSDYTNKQPSQIPDFITKAAIENKLALTRLCEAVHAKYYGQSEKAYRCGLIMPNKFTIVMDYHGFVGVEDQTTNYVSFDRNVISGDNVHREKCWSRFPDRFVLDLNESTISVLLADDGGSDPFLNIVDCYDTHIINGNIVGGYLHKDFSTGHRQESLCNIKILGSEFCSFENIHNSYSIGYDAECDGRDGLRWEWNYNSEYAINRVLFNRPGYIDLNGRIHRSDDTDIPDDKATLRYTEGIEDGSTTRSNIKNSLLHKIIDIDGTPSYRGRQPIQSGVNLLRGGYFWLKKINTANIDDAFFGYGGAYIYFYKDFDPNSEIYQAWCADMDEHANELGYLPDFEPLEFITARKIRFTTPILIPKGAKYFHACAYGKFSTDKWLGLQNKTSSSSLPRFHHYEHLAAWVCGYKNCTFSHGRTSIMNWHFAYLCFMRNSHVFLLGSGRSTNNGGMSNQSFNIDIEDNSFACGLTTIDNLENVEGGSTTRIHHPIQFYANGVRGYSLNLKKNVFLGMLRNTYGTTTNSIGYSHPIKYFCWKNNVFTKLNINHSDGKGSSLCKTLVENCNVIASQIPDDCEVVTKYVLNN